MAEQSDSQSGWVHDRRAARAYEQTSGWAFLVTLPEMAWEASLGFWFIVKGVQAFSDLVLRLAGISVMGESGRALA